MFSHTKVQKSLTVLEKKIYFIYTVNHLTLSPGITPFSITSANASYKMLVVPRDTHGV
jgi:hypothetical protein